MQHTVIDGVPVYWAQGPLPTTATLTFGCGSRDETFRTIGITHLIEHLAMSMLPRVHYDHNASVETEVTQFHATGKPAQLVEFLDIVCRALADLPLDRIEKEAGVLTAESGHVIHPTAGTLLARRFGTSGYGLSEWIGPGYDRIPAETVTQYAARFFTRQNAVLTLTGPLPEGLRLPLPDGPRPTHSISDPLPADGPRWSAEAVPCPGLGMIGPAMSPAWTIGMLILQERLTTIARREKGLSYEVDGDRVDLDSARAERMIWADARDGQEAEVARIIWDTARELATTGPSQDEIAHEVAAFVELVDDPRTVALDLHLRARADLVGDRYTTNAEWLAELSAVTPADVQAVLAEGMRTALLVVPQECSVELTGLDGEQVAQGGCMRSRTVPDGKVFKPPMLARMINGSARRSRLVLTSDGVAFCDDDGDVHTIKFTDVVGVEVNEGARTVFGRYGCVVPVDPDLFRGAEAVVAALDAAVDPWLCYARSELHNHD